MPKEQAGIITHERYDMKLGFDGRVLQRSTVTGVERYSHELYNQFNSQIDVKLFEPQLKGRFAQHLWVQTKLPLLARQAQVDALFCPVLAAPLNLDRDIPLVVTVHDLSFLRFPDMYSWSFRNYYRALMPRILRNASRVLTVSNTELGNIVTRFPFVEKKIEAIHSGVAGHFFYKGRDREPIILAVGSINKHKNLTVLVRAFEKILYRIPHRLVIVGGSRSIISADPDIGKLIRQLPAERVILTGHISDEVLADWYNRADIFVFPSLFEGFGFPPLEAMACGCPVIVSNASCLPEVCGDAAIYFDPSDVYSLANAIIVLAGDGPMKETVRERGRQHAAAFTWKRTAEQTLNAIRKVL